MLGKAANKLPKYHDLVSDTTRVQQERRCKSLCMKARKPAVAAKQHAAATLLQVSSSRTQLPQSRIQRTCIRSAKAIALARGGSMMPTKPQNTSESSVFPQATAITLDSNGRARDAKGTGELQSFVNNNQA